MIAGITMVNVLVPCEYSFIPTDADRRPVLVLTLSHGLRTIRENNRIPGRSSRVVEGQAL